MNFCVAILILQMEEKRQHFGHIIFCYFNKSKNTTKMQKWFVQCMKKNVLKWLVKLFTTGLCSMVREGNGNPLQYCCLENPMDGGAW